MSSFKFEDFKVIKSIAFGSFAKVLAVERNKKFYVIKAVKKIQARITPYGVTEKNVLKESNHPFIVKIFGCFTTPNQFCFLLEYLPGGDLGTYTDNHGPLPEYHAAFYGAQVVMAINFLHSKKVIHRDVKLKNILINKDGFIKVADFGLCRETDKEGFTNSFHITLLYIAPEMFKQEIYSYAVDWWAFGICMFVMIYGRFPFSIPCVPLKVRQVGEYIQNESIAFGVRISKEARNLLKGLLTRDPIKRLGTGRSFGVIQQHQFFTQIDLEKLEQKKMEPPFVPQLASDTDFQYFDPARVQEFTKLTYCSKPKTQMLDQFHDFDYIHPDWKN